MAAAARRRRLPSARLQRSGDLAPHGIALERGIDTDKALRRAVHAGAVGRANALEECHVFLLEAVGRTRCRTALRGEPGAQVEPDREVGLKPLLHPLFELCQHTRIEAPPATLVGEA